MAKSFKPLFKPETVVGGRGENIFQIVGRCRRLARELEWPREWVDDFCRRVSETQSYGAALAVVEEHFTLEGDDDNA